MPYTPSFITLQQVLEWIVGNLDHLPHEERKNGLSIIDTIALGEDGYSIVVKTADGVTMRFVLG